VEGMDKEGGSIVRSVLCRFGWICATPGAQAGQGLVEVAAPNPSPPAPLPSPFHPPPGEGRNLAENASKGAFLRRFSPLPGQGGWEMGEGLGVRGSRRLDRRL